MRKTCPSRCELVGERLERVAARGVQLEDANQRLRFLRVRLDRLVAVVDVDVAERGEARRPALPDLLVHPLEHFRPQVVAVVLGDGGHHVERQCTGRAGAELVVDERQLHAAGVLQFLQANGVPHVAADAIELVAEDRLDLLALGVGLHPGEHLVEGDPLRTSLGGLGDDELADDVPAVRLGPFAVQPEVGHRCEYPSRCSRDDTRAHITTFMTPSPLRHATEPPRADGRSSDISIASSSLITRP